MIRLMFKIASLTSLLKNKPLEYRGRRKRLVRRMIVVVCRKVAKKVVKSCWGLDMTLKVDPTGVADGFDV